MQREGGVQGVRRMASGDHLQVSQQFLAEVGVGAILNDHQGPFVGRPAAEIGDALLGGNDLHRVLTMVHVADQRHDGADLAAFRGRGAGKDGKVGVAGKVARSADAVHHLPAHDVGAVYVAEDIDLDGRVDGDEPKPPHHFGAIADFLGTHQNARTEEFQIVIKILQHFVAETQRAGAGKRDALLAEQVGH